MENKAKCLGDESGAIMVIAMLLLALLTIIGFMSLTRSSTELEIARNDVLYRRNFLKADVVNVTALGIIDNLNRNSPEVLENFDRPWLWNLHVTANVGLDFSDPGQWDINADGTGNNCQHVNGFDRDGIFDTHFAVAARRVPGGTQDARGNPLLVTQYEVFSRYASDDGQVIVHSGYRQ